MAISQIQTYDESTINSSQSRDQIVSKLDQILSEIRVNDIRKIAQELEGNIGNYKAWAKLANLYDKLGNQKMSDACWEQANYFKENQ